MNEIYLEFYLILKAKVRTTSPSNEPYRGSIFFHLEKKMLKKKRIPPESTGIVFFKFQKKKSLPFPPEDSISRKWNELWKKRSQLSTGESEKIEANEERKSIKDGDDDVEDGRRQTPAKT